MFNSQISVKLIGGPVHGRKMILPELSPTLKIPIKNKDISLWNVDYNTPLGVSFSECRYHLTNVIYKGVFYYIHQDLKPSESRMLQKAYDEMKLAEFYESRLVKI